MKTNFDAKSARLKSDSRSILLWFRRDLRLEDNPSLQFAVESGLNIIPIYIHSPDEDGDWGPGGATKWWLAQSLRVLDADLRERGARLVLRSGPALKILRSLVRETQAVTVVWARRYEP